MGIHKRLFCSKSSTSTDTLHQLASCSLRSALLADKMDVTWHSKADNRNQSALALASLLPFIFSFTPQRALYPLHPFQHNSLSTKISPSGISIAARSALKSSCPYSKRFGWNGRTAHTFITTVTARYYLPYQVGLPHNGGDDWP